MRFVRIIFYMVLILSGITFAALNSGSVLLNLYLTTLTLPISILMTIMLGIGLVLGVVLFLAKYWQLKVEVLKLKNQLKITEKEIKNLRDIPLKNQH